MMSGCLGAQAQAGLAEFLAEVHLPTILVDVLILHNLKAISIKSTAPNV